MRGELKKMISHMAEVPGNPCHEFKEGWGILDTPLKVGKAMFLTS